MVSDELSPALLWLTLVSLPLCNFLLLRALYRWSIWAGALWRLSRLDLQTVPTHPDLAGGLGHLSEPVLGFAVVLTSVNVVIAAAWADRIFFAGQSFKVFADEFAALVLLGELLAFLPLTPLSTQLLHARLQGLVDYGVFALAYTRQFHERWITSGDRQDLLGTSDIQSLADLANSYAVVTKMRVVPFSPRQVLVVFVSMALPMLPLIATEVPISALLSSAGRALLGGLPP